jgi:hypothetical protein
LEDKYWILVDMVAREEDIASNKEYLELYYNQYCGILTQGGMTLLSPRYAQLFHGVLYQMALCCNTAMMADNKSNCMRTARKSILDQMAGGWAGQLQSLLTVGLQLSKPEESCREILHEIITKMVNAKGNSIMKRYYANYLARGGKKSSLSSNREARQQEGLGKRKKSVAAATTPPLGPT